MEKKVKEVKKMKHFLSLLAFRTRSFFTRLSFWGIICLAILRFTYGVPFAVLLQLAFQNKELSSYFFSYLFISIIILPIMEIWRFFFEIRSGSSLGEALEGGIGALYLNLITPYEFILDLKCIKILGIWHIIRKIIQTLLWWGMFAWVIYFSLNNGNISEYIFKMPIETIVRKTGITLAVYIFFTAIISLYEKRKTKRLTAEMKQHTSSQGTHGQKYYNRYPEHIPSSCKACGGPYPECRASCTLFDN